MGDPATLDSHGLAGTPAPLLREQALQLFDDLDRLAGFERRVRELVAEMGRVAAGGQGPGCRSPE